MVDNLIIGETDYSDDIYETDEPTCDCPDTLIETEHCDIAVEVTLPLSARVLPNFKQVKLESVRVWLMGRVTP